MCMLSPSQPFRWKMLLRDIALLVTVFTFIGFTPINTSLGWLHMTQMGIVMVFAVAGPFLVTRLLYKEQHLRFPFHFGRSWYKREIAYILLAALFAYLVFPFYLGQGSYLNWEVALDPSHLVRLFIGTNALGIWDELFFIGTVLALLRTHIPFFWANLIQGICFTAFLYELGFRGWGPLIIFFFTISQGYIFSKSKSFLYILTIHLTVDFVLFLTLIHLHFPHHLRIFITSPF